MTRRRWLLAAAYAVLVWPAIDYVRWHRTGRSPL